MSEDLKCLYELFPTWTKEDINALYVDLGRNLDLVISRISEGHVSPWSFKSAQGNHAPSKPSARHLNQRKSYRPKERIHSSIPKDSQKVDIHSHKVTLQENAFEEQSPEQTSNRLEATEDKESVKEIEVDITACTGICQDDELVLMPNIKVRHDSAFVESPIVVLPNIKENSSFTVDPPLVNLPFSLRSNECGPDFTSHYCPSDRSNILPPSMVLDDLFPDSIRKIRQITRTNGFY